MSLFGISEKKELEVVKKELAEIQQQFEESKSQCDSLSAEVDGLKAKLLPEHYTLSDLKAEISSKQERLDGIISKLSEAEKKLSDLNSQIIETSDEILYQSVGIYTPHYDFMKADEYKAKLLEIRTRQKDMVKAKTAVTGTNNWTVDGNAAKGKKMISDTQKLLLRAFNAECDDIVEHVKFGNVEASEKKITASRDAISKLGTIMSISITPQYYRLKIEELYLAYEYQQKKQEEKEAAKEARARMREEAKLAKEIEEARKKLEKEQTHYMNALKKLTSQLESASEGADRQALLEKKAEVEQRLSKIDKDFQEVDYREANQKAGYVYIISNIGAFGENVYKIGMTRRLDPMERVDELGDASVPFDFDVHAMIFSENAPALEAALHNAFSDRKLNFINQRREFFNVSLDEIKAVVKANYDKTVEFVEVAPAEQYRETLAIKSSK